MNEPLDEVQWSLPANIVHYHYGGIHTNSVHKYFMDSAFFDHTSNNAIIRAQIKFETQHILEDRKLFEERLRQMSGVEFMVVQEPTMIREGGDSGVWVIRKQDRQKRANGGEDILTVLGTYFVVGEHIYQAPSISDILQSRLLAVTTTLTNVMLLASSMSQFSLADGYSYLPTSSSTTTDKPPNSQRQASQPQSSSLRETPAPDATQPQQQQQLQSQQQTQSQTSTQKDTNILFESINLFRRYNTEFMDDNPLQGEPGSLIFSSTNQHVQTQRAKAEAEAAAQQALKASGINAGKQKNPLTATSSGSPFGSTGAGGGGHGLAGGASASSSGAAAAGLGIAGTKKKNIAGRLSLSGPKPKKKKTRLSTSASAAPTPKPAS